MEIFFIINDYILNLICQIFANNFSNKIVFFSFFIKRLLRQIVIRYIRKKNPQVKSPQESVELSNLQMVNCFLSFFINSLNIFFTFIRIYYLVRIYWNN